MSLVTEPLVEEKSFSEPNEKGFSKWFDFVTDMIMCMDAEGITGKYRPTMRKKTKEYWL